MAFLRINKTDAGRLKKTVQAKERTHPAQRVGPPLTGAGSNWILVTLAEDLTGSAAGTAYETHWDEAAEDWDQATTTIPVRGWKLDGTLSEGTQAWCCWWSGIWWVLIPEVCPS